MSKCSKCGCANLTDKQGGTKLMPYGQDDALVCPDCFIADDKMVFAYVNRHRKDFGIPEHAEIDSIVIHKIVSQDAGGEQTEVTIDAKMTHGATVH